MSAIINLYLSYMRIEGEPVPGITEDDRRTQNSFVTKGEDIITPNHFSLTDYISYFSGGAHEISQHKDPEEHPDPSKKPQYYGNQAINEFNGLPLNPREAQRTLELEDGNGVNINTRM